MPWIAVVVVVAVAARLHRVDAHDLRLDEAYVQWVATLPLADMLDVITTTDSHPPLHYLVQGAWRVVGDSELAIRSLSVLLSAAVVGLVFVVADRFAGRRAAVAASLLAAVSPWQVVYAQDARMYALAAALLAALLLVAVRVVEGGPVTLRTAMAYVAVVTAALFTHNTMAISVGTVSVVVALLLRAAGRGDDLRRWLVAGGVALVVWVAWWPTLLEQVGRLDRNLSWVPPVDGSVVADALRAPWSWFVDRPGWAGVWIDVGVVAVVAAGGWSLRRRPATVLLVATAITTPLVVLVMSRQQDVPLDRPLVPSAVAVYVLVGAGIGRVRRPVGAGVLVALLVVAGVGLAQAYRDRSSTEWETAARRLDRRVADDDTVVYVANYGWLGLRSYLSADVTQVGLPVDFDEVPVWENAVTPESLRRLEPLLDEAGSVWLVHVREPALDPERTAFARLSTRRSLTECFRVDNVEVYRFDRDGPADPGCALVE